MITIYHNPRCSKSRQGLEVLKDSGKEFTVVKYLEEVPSVKELTEVIAKLNISPDQLIRKTEAIWKSDFKGKSLSDKELIAAMVQNPKLIERPIVVDGKNAVIGRPIENISLLIKS